MNGDGRRPKTMASHRAASNDEAYAANGSGNRQADGMADLWRACYTDRESDGIRRVPLDELFLPAARGDRGLS